jgi:Co/Zn/Cd efflux system component
MWLLTRFERRTDKLAPANVFALRVAKSLLIAIGLIGIALLIGIAGYHWIAGFDWLDSLLEASMILGGMGPIKELPNSGAKIFASIYALFSGLVFIGVMGFVLAPAAHRLLHKFHVDEEDVKKSDRKKK